MNENKYSKNKRAKKLMGLRKKGTPLFVPVELGYYCPICNSKSKPLRFSEYNSFMWCPNCNLDIPSCLCKMRHEPNIIDKHSPIRERIEMQTEIFLDSVEEIKKRGGST